jgi:mRNA interferase MazF
MELRRGDIVIVVASGDSGKPRPAVIVQTNRLLHGDMIVVCPMSSDISDVPTIRPIVSASRENGLQVTSQLMTDRIAAVRRTRIRRVIGTLDTKTQGELDHALVFLLGLDGQTDEA